jgi:aromatic ring-cleaving dioxygenase
LNFKQGHRNNPTGDNTFKPGQLQFYHHIFKAMASIVEATTLSNTDAATADAADSVVELYRPQFLEYHFHVYWTPESNDHAQRLFDTIEALDREDKFVCKVLHLNLRPIGPHTACSFQNWVPIEYFAIVYDWFLLNLENFPGCSLFIHPLSLREKLDHSVRCALIGKQYPLLIDVLQEELPEVDSLYPELGLGYSNPQGPQVAPVNPSENIHSPVLLEYHFHIYWQPQYYEQAQALASLAKAADAAGKFVCKVGRLSNEPLGPHTVCSCQTWVPIEYFTLAYDWFATQKENFPDLCIFIHPLSVREKFDHSDRGAFMSQVYPLNLLILEDVLPEPAMMYPHLGLGYSKK